jgi:hypothetical protein
MVAGLPSEAIGQRDDPGGSEQQPGAPLTDPHPARRTLLLADSPHRKRQWSSHGQPDGSR